MCDTYETKRDATQHDVLYTIKFQLATSVRYSYDDFNVFHLRDHNHHKVQPIDIPLQLLRST